MPSAATTSRLMSLATRRPELAWREGMAISQARNAHFSHTVEYLEEALRGDFNSIEADIRFTDGVAVVAHNRASDYTFTLDDWLKIVSPSGRMLRFDVKDSAALEPTLNAVQGAGLEDWRTTFNMTVEKAARTVPSQAQDPVNLFSDAVDLERALQVRRAMPRAHIGLNVPDYSPAGFAALAEVDEKLGAPSMVAIEAQRAEPWMVKALHDRNVIVGAWNYPPDFVPDDTNRLITELRAMGFDGQIDLRDASNAMLTP